MDHSSQCWSEVFFFIYLNVCYYRLLGFLTFIFTRWCKDAFTVWWDI